MPDRVRVVLLAIVLVSLVLATGCGGGSSSAANSSGIAPTPTATTPSASPLAVLKTDQSGSFFFPAGTLPYPIQGRVSTDRNVNGTVVQVVPYHIGTSSGYRLLATLPGGDVLWTDADMPAADAKALGSSDANPSRWVWMTPISHLASVYHATYQSSGTQAVHQVKHFLAISPSAPINRPFISVFQSQFSPRTFLRAADLAGGLATFSRTLMPSIAGNAVQQFVEPASPGLQAMKSQVRDWEGTKIFFQLSLSNALGDIFAAPFVGALNYGFSKIPLGVSTNTQLQQVSAQLTAISNQIQALTGAVVSVAKFVLPNAVKANAINPVNTFINTQQTNVAAISTSYRPWDPTTDSSVGQSFLSLVNQANAFIYASTIASAGLNTGITAGQGNVITGNNEAVASPYGSQAASWAFYYDFRNDITVTPSVQNGASYYVFNLAEAANMLQESYNSALNSAAFPVNTLTSCQRLMNGIAPAVGAGLNQNGLNAMARRMGQQAPGVLLGGNSAWPGPPAVTCCSPTPCPLSSPWPGANAVWAEPGVVLANGNTLGHPFPGVTGVATPNNFAPQPNGALWSPTGNEFTSSGTKTGVNINTTVEGFAVGSTMGWYIPTGSQLKDLAARAQQVAAQSCGRNPVTGATVQTSGNYAVPFGLMQLGLLSYENWLNNPDHVRIYCNYDKSKNSMNEYDNQNGGSIITNEDNNGVGDTCGNNGCDFRPQGGTLAIVLLARPFPGAPANADVYNTGFNMGDSSISSVPPYVGSSKTYGWLNGFYVPSVWQSDLPLACNLPPSEIVITQEGTSNSGISVPPGQSRQLHAYALWLVPMDGNHTNQGGGVINTYIIYSEVTNLVEWLSSDYTVADVSNFGATISQISAASINAGVIPAPSPSPSPGAPSATPTPVPIAGSVAGATLTVLNPVLSGNPSPGAIPSATISGGTIANFVTVSGSVSGGYIIGSPNYTNPISGGTVCGGTLGSGTVSGGLLYNLFDGNGTLQGTMLTGGTISNAQITNATVVVPSTGTAGLLSVHDPTRPVTITASLMTNANTTPPANTGPPSSWTFVTVPNSSAYPSLQLDAGTFTPPTLSYLLISPNNLQLAGSGTINQTFYLTGFYTDGSARDLSTSATWQLLIPTPAGTAPANASAFFSQAPLSRNVLQVPPSFAYQGIEVVSASVGGLKATALIQARLNTGQGDR